MADVVLAECGGQAWLIQGVQHIDDLLANTLAPQVSIEVVPCESKSHVLDLWEAAGGDDPSDMWMIHPNIVNRVRGQIGQPELRFAAMSLAIDDRARHVLNEAVGVARARPDQVLVLRRRIPPGAAPSAASIADLRCTLIEAELATAGVPPARMRRETLDDGDGDSISIAFTPA